MTTRLVIDDAFIEKWQRKYDDIERDGPEYLAILTLVASEIARAQTLSQETFFRLRDWKSKRLKGYVRAEHFPDYSERIRQAVQAPEETKLAILDEVFGIGVPFATTILHFIYPDSFPIMDIRTVETLNHGGYLHSEQRSQKRYPQFRKVILCIQGMCPKWSLRQIDRALFAYHKIQLKPSRLGEKCKDKK